MLLCATKGRVQSRNGKRLFMLAARQRFGWCGCDKTLNASAAQDWAFWVGRVRPPWRFGLVYPRRGMSSRLQREFAQILLWPNVVHVLVMGE